MRPSKFIKVQAFNLATTSWEDITNGVISINTVTGSDTFEGYWDQPDTGQFVITTRGATSDPNLNPLITTNTIIKIFQDTEDNIYIPSDEALFYGFITDVKVEYRKNDTQIVTINGTDLMGYLNRLVITQDFIDTNITPIYPDNVVPADYLINYATYALAPELEGIFQIYYTSQIDNIAPYEQLVPYFLELPPTAKIKVEPGKTLYELIALGMSSGLMRYESSYVPNQYAFLPYYKNDIAYYSQIEEVLEYRRNFYARTSESDPWQYEYAESDLGVFTFRAITLNNGLNKMINQVSVNNTNPANGDLLKIDPLSSDANVIQYGPAHLDAQTSYTTTSNPFWLSSNAIVDQAEYFQTNILFDQAEPKTTIETITIDGTKWFGPENQYNRIPDTGNPIFIQHRLENDEYITGYYKIVGVKHLVTENTWLVELILGPSQYEILKANRPKTPTFTITADEEPNEDGYYTTATSFTATIDNYTPEDWANIEKIEWFVNYFLIVFNTPASPGNPPSQLNETLTYLNNPLPVFNGTSMTWNYDDNGTFEAYGTAGDIFSIMVGPGSYDPYVLFTTKDGFSTWFQLPYINIIAATAHADFAFTKDAQERVTFIDNSGADTNTWEWDFGDGTTYSGKNPPVKQYSAAGTYNVRLDVNNGFTTDHIIKPITIEVYQIPVQYIKLRYQGTVTRPAGATEYPVDLIDTIGLLELKNELYQETGGIQPFYFGRIGTMEKVQELSKGNGYQYLRILDDPVTRANHFEWIYQSSPLSPTDPNIPYSPYGPNYITDYSSGGPLDPMSQTHIPVWTDTPARGTVGGTVPKYRFIPVITDNEDGSQTKSIDIDINFWYSQTYVTGSKTSSSTSVYRNYRNQRPAGSSSASPLGPTAETYLPAGRLASLAYWPQWGDDYGSAFNQSKKLKEIIIWPGMDTKVKKTTAKQLLTIPGGGGSTAWFFDPPSDPPLDRYGVIPGKTYLPIEIAVSSDGTTFHKIGEAEYVSGNTLTTTYDVSMPPFSNAPILT